MLAPNARYTAFARTVHARVWGFDLDAIQVNDGVQRLHWARLLCFGSVHYRIGNRRDHAGRDFCTVHPLEVRDFCRVYLPLLMAK